MKIKFRALCLAALVVAMAFASVASAAPMFLIRNENGIASTLTYDTSTKTFSTSDLSIAGTLAGHTLHSYNNYKNVLTVGKDSISIFAANGSTPKWLGTSKLTGDNMAGVRDFAMDTDGNLVFVVSSDVTDHNFAIRISSDITTLPSSIISVDLGAGAVDMLVAWDHFFAIVSGDSNDISTTSPGGYVALEFPANPYKFDPARSADIAPLFGYAGIGSWVSQDRSISFSSVNSDDVAYLSTGYSLYKFDKPSYNINKTTTFSITDVYSGDIMALAFDTNNGYLLGIESKDQKIELRRWDSASDFSSYRSKQINLTKEFDNEGIASIHSFDIVYDADNDYVIVINPEDAICIYEPTANTFSFVASYDLEGSYAALLASTGSSSGGDDTPSTKATVAAVSATDAAALADAKTGLGMADTDTFAGSTVVVGAEKDSTVETTIKEKLENDTTSASVSALATVTPDANGFVVLSGTAFEGKDPAKTFFYFVDSNGALIDGTLLTSTGAKASTSDSVYLGSSKALTSGTTYTVYTATTSTKSSGDDDSGDTGSSSSGCDAGFGLMSLAALLAVTTLSKRR